MKTELLIVLAASISVAMAAVMPCSGNKGPMPKSVSIADCDAGERCEFVRGSSIKADVVFTARELTTNQSETKANKFSLKFLTFNR